MVKFKATVAARRSAVAKAGGSTEDSVASNVVKVKGELAGLLKKMKADPTVELASLNYKRYISAVPNGRRSPRARSSRSAEPAACFLVWIHGE
jgi:hypothetical protein